MAEMSYYLCRLCAFKCLMPGLLIFSSEGIMRDIPRKIEDCLQFTISENDQFPKIICGDCIYKLDVAYDFKTKCLDSQYYIYELFKYEMLAYDLTTKNHLEDPNYPCMSLNDDINEHTENQELEHMVDEAHLHTTDSNVSKIIQYHDSEITEYQIQQLEQNLNGNINHNPKDTMSLSDITLYTFDSISDAEPADSPDIPIASPDIETNTLQSNENENETPNAEDETNAVDHSARGPELKNGNRKVPKEKSVKQCKDCGKSFNTNYKLKEHERTHTNETPFHCTKEGCTKKFRSKIGLAQHEAQHRGQYKFTCDICGKGFEIKSYLTIHFKTHNSDKPFKCSMCDLSFKAKQGLIDHENRHLGLKPYQCNQCNKRFITKSLCLSHYQTHSKTVKREHQCTTCGKLFASKSCMKMHMKIHFDDKQYMCEFCGKVFLARTDLKLHETSHTGEKQYICETCGKAFNRPNSLNNHARLHTGVRPYKCKFCTQTFTQSSTMRIHMRLHTGERPYVCTENLCTKKFISKTSLRRHLQSHNRKKQGNILLELPNSIDDKTKKYENK